MNPIVIVAAAVAAYFLFLKNDPAKQADSPGGRRSPQYPTTVAVNQNQTLVQQLGGAAGIADGANRLLSGATGLWDRMAAADDNDEFEYP